MSSFGEWDQQDSSSHISWSNLVLLGAIVASDWPLPARTSTTISLTYYCSLPVWGCTYKTKVNNSFSNLFQKHWLLNLLAVPSVPAWHGFYWKEWLQYKRPVTLPDWKFVSATTCNPKHGNSCSRNQEDNPGISHHYDRAS